LVPTVLITGAAGNLGSRLARRLSSEPVKLRLMMRQRAMTGKIMYVILAGGVTFILEG
jgi:short-subunit dehydrogenase